MDETSRYGDAPLGKSVEEVEQESGERTGHAGDAADPARAADPVGGALLIPAGANANASAVPAVVNVAALHEDAGHAGAAQARADDHPGLGSETTENSQG